MKKPNPRLMRRFEMFYLHPLLSVVLSLALTVGLAGCQKKEQEQANKQIDQAAGKVGEKMGEAEKTLGKETQQAGKYVDDATITAKVKAAILADPMLKVLQIAVTTTNGVVKLNGVVDSQKSLDHSLAVARAVNGVKSVESGLIIKPAQ